MESDEIGHCQVETGVPYCATQNPGRRMRAPLTPIPVSDLFDRVGVDVVQLPVSDRGNKYAAAFIDCMS